ncbi:prolow-density lipoprotein receptor-related protein 1-like [Saccostrea cucullata]|uniref:prolow-density lipoprotein receptor-related protein 1-like n=1 Tax=Saccostrea cuccullata TaxID=36930 RepID=UPI002ED4A741
MVTLHAAKFLVLASVFGPITYGTAADKGLILGMWSPAAFATITEIPVKDADYFGNVSKTLTPSTVQTYSIASDPQNKVVFAAIRDSIYKFQNFTIWQNGTVSLSLAHKGKSSAFGQIAFDYSSGNIYWCDSLLKWIAVKPAYSNNDTIYTVVVHKDLYQPEGLALDPENGLMFFTDNEPHPRIEKASMDGENRTTIIHTGLIRVLALSVDTDRDLLFWADYGRHTIEVSDYDGLNRRVIRRNNNVPATGLHYYQNMLHVSSLKARLIFGVDTISGSQLYNLQLSGQPYAIHVYDGESARSYAGQCSSRGCQHICVNSPVGAKCLCAEGYLLSSDGKSCTDRSWFHERGFIVSNATHFAMVEVQFINGGKGWIPFLIPSAIIGSFAVDANLHIIYFLDTSSNALEELNIINRQIRTLATNVVATDLIFDWIANLLAWIEPAQSAIRAFSITSGTTTLIYSGLQQPSSLTVDAHNGDLYWISGTSRKTIMRGNWNRNSPTTIVSEENLSNPTSLRYDVTSHRIYWLDNSMIKSSFINGSDIKSHLITFGATEALPYKDFFGWINGNKTYFARRSAISAEYEVDVIQNIKHMTIFDALIQQDRRGSCQILNGGCEGICVPLQNGRKCECDFGLQAKDLTCESSFFLKNFIIVLDYSHGRILQADINTGNIVKLPINIQNSPGITFDKSAMELIYSEVQTKTIMSTTLHGTNTSLIYATGFAHADRLTIDYSTGNIYYTAVGSSQSQSYIGVIHRRSLLHKTLLTNLHSPREIAVYPSKGFLYWTAFGNIAEISRSYMDGTSKMYIATTNIGWPNGFSIDFATNKIFWADGLKNSIEYSDLNGENRNILTTDSDAHLMSIVVHGQYLYYTAWNRQRITKMDKATGAKLIFMPNYPELGRLDSLDIYADDTMDVNAICSKKNRNCSTFCFSTPTGRTCGCQDNVNLQADQKTCQGVFRCTSPLPNINLLDCLAFPGEICEFECKPGFRRDVNTSITCNQLSQWDPPTASLCSEIFCSPSLTNAVLSSNCSRSVNKSCTFECSEGYSRTTLQSLMCTMNGTWNLDTNSLCLRSSCSKTIQNGQFTNCSAKIGETCQYGCNSPFEINPKILNVTCHTSREWSHDTNNLCIQLCTPTIQNGNLGPGCPRTIGSTCSFSCDIGHKSSISSQSIICTSDGSWSETTAELCQRSSCSKSIQNGKFIDCQSNIGETCQYECNSPFEMNPSFTNVTCNSSSYWNHDPGDLCV